MKLMKAIEILQNKILNKSPFNNRPMNFKSVDEIKMYLDSTNYCSESQLWISSAVIRCKYGVISYVDFILESIINIFSEIAKNKPQFSDFKTIGEIREFLMNAEYDDKLSPTPTPVIEFKPYQDFVLESMIRATIQILNSDSIEVEMNKLYNGVFQNINQSDKKLGLSKEESEKLWKDFFNKK